MWGNFMFSRIQTNIKINALPRPHINKSEGANCRKLPKTGKKDDIQSYIDLFFLSFVINNIFLTNVNS